MKAEAKLPRLTKCPQCLNYERTTACRFCGISKLGPQLYVVPGESFYTLSPEVEEHGCRRVEFGGELRGHAVHVVAVVAPPDPEVGLLDPWLVDLKATDRAGNLLPVSYPEARHLAGAIARRLF